ncbi:MAG: nitronate monooxygenase [Deltaproteobacteria bacterium]|jgi:NADH:quinone reductase (non-electrogenic)|nr:nitronate monooxygenase [Deltaproteobacteria bacterium]MBT4639605.1 nitronate monooxygenase [Deltaproteobacteria bacterium]MBT6504899.1 nitronate monooxygenase [Deltaproteobacteria bacterium]MBT7153345.1 nitronate monooxygenase [Deltaproteobacteria bacterium]MBT7715631.1 nitronate monooxygenase [Deltaproteobacteria bacterium]
MIKTRITELFGIERPILQGGMMWLARSELAAALANAGGIGFMTALTYPEAEGLRDEIRKTRTMTDKPFGINLTFLPSLRQPDYPSYIQVCIDEGIKIIETAGRNPEPYMDQLKSAGITVIHKCTSVRHAVKAEKVGCDAVSIDGFEAAGHPGEDDVTTLVLVPLTRDAISIPIVASGGFGDGRGLVGALGLGADAINMGTRFMATKEAPIHENVKQALIKSDELNTKLIMRTLRNTERTLHNTVVDKVLEVESRGNTTIEDLIPFVSGLGGKKMLEEGDLESGILSAGQSMGFVHDIPTVQELMDRIMKQAEDIIKEKFTQVISPT